MMKKFIALFVALLLTFGQGTAYAAVGEPYGVGYNNPRELAAAIRESLKHDAKGVYPVDKKKCLPNGYSCASAQQYLAGFQKSDPGANLRSVGELPAYLETLVEGKPEGDYWMSCLKKGTMVAMWNCLARPLERNERAWKNPVTKKFVLAGKCTNPMGLRVNAPECIEKHVYLDKGDEHHIGLLGPDALPKSTCTSILKAGETEWSNLLLDECPRMGCDYSGPSRDLKLPVQPGIRVSYRAEVSGWYKLRLPASMLRSEDVIVDCVIKPNRTQSRGMITAKRHYHQGVAYLGYANRDLTVPKGAFMHTWLWASSLAPRR